MAFEDVYDLQLQEQQQRSLYDAYGPSAGQVPFRVNPMPHLPPFVALSFPPTFIDPVAGFVATRALDALLLTFYLRRFPKVVSGRADAGIAAKLVLSLPVFLNPLFGQVNVLLLVFLGEFILARLRGQDFASGP
ncbi:MAG: hypothetical protein GTO49_34170 [Anaerolineae bacterium]|nr:hypothetical protein [Anaerolineae bacterium]